MKIPKATKLPSGKWRVQIMVDGRSYSITRKTKLEAEREAAAIRIDAKAAPSEKTLDEVIERYIRLRDKVVSPSTVLGYEDIRRNRFKHYMDLPISKINFQQMVNDEDRSPKTVRNAFSLVRAALKSSGVQIPYNVTLPPLKPSERPFLSPDEIKTLIKLVNGKNFEAAVLLGLHGLRKSEIYALKGSDVKDGLIHVHSVLIRGGADGKRMLKNSTKTYGSDRYVPILIDRLRELIPSGSQRICKDYPEATFRRLKKLSVENGLPEIGFHSLRHSFASLAYHLGLSELQTMKLGGWSNPATMRNIYTHLAEKDRNEAAEKLRSFFE